VGRGSQAVLKGEPGALHVRIEAPPTVGRAPVWEYPCGFADPEAAQDAQAGDSAPEILALLEDMRAGVHIAILLDTLESLRRGRRADGFIAVVDGMARALKVKPLVDVADGQLRLLGAARSFRRGLERLLNQVGPREHLAVVHVRNQETVVEMAAGRRNEQVPRGSTSGCERPAPRCPPTQGPVSLRYWR
jgi:fatty acid-binding protein DegV